jgi:hypothetical protein
VCSKQSADNRTLSDRPGCAAGAQYEPGPSSSASGHALEKRRWLGRLFAGEFAAMMMTELRGASNAKAKRDLSWKPRYASWREGFLTGLS